MVEMGNQASANGSVQCCLSGPYHASGIVSSRMGTKRKMKQMWPLPLMALIFSQEVFVSPPKVLIFLGLWFPLGSDHSVLDRVSPSDGLSVLPPPSPQCRFQGWGVADGAGGPERGPGLPRGSRELSVLAYQSPGGRVKCRC